MSKLLTTEEAANFLTVKKNTLEIWRSQGKGPDFVKVGRCVRYRAEDLESYVGAQTRTNTCAA